MHGFNHLVLGRAHHDSIFDAHDEAADHEVSGNAALLCKQRKRAATALASGDTERLRLLRADLHRVHDEVVQQPARQDDVVGQRLDAGRLLAPHVVGRCDDTL